MLLFLPVGLFVLGALLILLGKLRNPETSPFERRQHKTGAYARVHRRLRRAGLLQTTPGFAVVVVGTLSGLALLVATLVTGKVWIGVVGAALVPMVGWFYLTFRERSYLKRASGELVPFLRKIESQVRAGRLPQAAFAQAVSESSLLRPPLEPAIVQLRLNRPFIEVLRESTTRLPLRSWEQFVRQLEIHAETGGDLAEIITDAVAQINQLIQLQARMGAEYATFAKQQMILVAVGIGAYPGLAAMGLLGELTGSLAGWGAMGVAAFMMFIGIFYGQRSLRDIESKLEF